MESKLDRMVVTMLNGIDLVKHAPLFEKHNINFDLYRSLNEEDLRTIGIEDKEEIDSLIKYAKTSRKIEKWPDLKNLQFEEITEILKNTEEYLHTANVACSFVQQSMQNGKPLDIIVHNDTAASSAIATICDKIQAENEAIINEIDLLMKDVGRKNDESVPVLVPVKKIFFGLATAGALTSVILAAVFYWRREFFGMRLPFKNTVQ